MAMDFANYLNTHSTAIAIREQRATQIANNLANANTPNYQAKDIDFASAYKQAMAAEKQIVNTNANHISNTANNFTHQLKYRQPQQVSLDGNTVDKDVEVTEFVRNSLAYQTSLTFLDNKIKTMLSAIRGE